MSDRLDSIDERLRAVEEGLVELATMARMMRALVALFTLSLGYDLSAVI